MNNRKSVLFFTIALFFISFLNAQNEITINEVLQKTKEACLSLKSIKYEIQQRNAKGKYGFPTIEATIIQQKADAINIGFDNAYIKAIGTIKEKSEVENFSYAYDGDSFTYQKGSSDIKKVNNPKRKTVMSMLQQHLFMLRFFPFTQEEPFKPRGSGLYTFEGIEKINGKLCYKIMSVTVFKTQNPSPETKKKSLTTKDIWWVDTETYLPVAYSDGFLYKEITILSYE
ncbi:LolA-like protein [Hanstruepera marina]|uniref:hypothetical protein n=1 Tax=Hanstruepera marina TaxID=2873265 RepID=UPI001CA6AFFA|nr:hypothetical protein [Hanstruepera marina]